MHGDSATSDLTDMVDQIPSTITEEMASQVTTDVSSGNTRVEEESTSLTLNISTDEGPLGATIGPSKSHGSGPEDEEAPTETLTETGVEVMRQHHSFETLNETDQIDTMMTGLKLMNQSILVSKQSQSIDDPHFSDFDEYDDGTNSNSRPLYKKSSVTDLLSEMSTSPEDQEAINNYYNGHHRRVIRQSSGFVKKAPYAQCNTLSSSRNQPPRSICRYVDKYFDESELSETSKMDLLVETDRIVE